MLRNLRPVTTSVWPDRGSSARSARLHVVTGKGGTGKTTVAAALALALASGGRRTLLVEVEGRQGIAQLFDTPPLPYEERKIAVAPGGGEVRALAVDAEAALLEYFEMFYRLGMAGRDAAPDGRDRVRHHARARPARRAAHRQGQGVRQPHRTPTAAPSTTPSCSTPRRPAGWSRSSTSPGRWPTWPAAGPIHSQAEGVVELLHSPRTAVHLVTLLEDLPVTETLETVDELAAAGLPVGAVIVNRVRAAVAAGPLGRRRRARPGGRRPDPRRAGRAPAWTWRPR